MQSHTEAEAKRLGGRIEILRDRTYPRATAKSIAERLADSGVPIIIEQITRSAKTGRRIKRFLPAAPGSKPMTITLDVLLDPKIDLYDGDNEWAERARHLRLTFLKLQDLIEAIVPQKIRIKAIVYEALGGELKLTDEYQHLVRLALEIQSGIVSELLAMNGMLGDPDLRYWMKRGVD